jgi:8-oxo-dGTP pyrophosphatase MutT (NUDIX family)
MSRAARVRPLLALAALVVLAAGSLAPGVADACAVCLTQDSKAFAWALLKGTALLSLTPLAVIGLGVWYLRRRARQLDAAEAAEAARREAEEAAARASAPHGAARPA